jgi:hypothetical protein
MAGAISATRDAEKGSRENQKKDQAFHHHSAITTIGITLKLTGRQYLIFLHDGPGQPPAELTHAIFIN